MARRTVLYDTHAALGAKIVDFGGWDMPLHYGSQIEEHHAVRRDAGMFDVSHMAVVDLKGERVRPFLRRLLANDVAKLKAAGKALYTCMLDHDGGILDDLIVYFLTEDCFRLVVNAGTADKDIRWIKGEAGDFGVEVCERTDLAMIAVQGPNARSKAAAGLDSRVSEQALGLPPFSGLGWGDYFVARTGYTGEDGWEVMLPRRLAAETWDLFLNHGISACGLGARDTLRLEAGMNLYGADMDESTTPLDSALSWTVAWEPEDRCFTGREALEAQRRDGVKRKLVGLLLEGRGVMRAHQRVVVDGIGDGEMTSGTYSPSLGRSIGLARVPRATQERCEVDIRGRLQAAKVVKPPFVRNGQPCIDL